MALSATLASLIVNIILNSRGFNSQMSDHRRNIVQTAAKFYLLRTAVLAAVNSMSRMVNRAAEIEDGFTNVERIANNLRNTTFRGDLFNLDEQLKGINIDKLQKAAQAVARLGIRENIIEITKTIALFSKTAQMAEDDAALILGRITQLFNLPDRPRAIEELSNSIVEVAETMATSEKEITDVLSRIGPTGQLAGFSVTELVGIAGTIKAIGQRSEAAGTAVQRLFIKFFANTSEVIQALRITEAEAANLAQLVNTDVNAAFIKFLEIIGNERFDGAADILSDIELSTARVIPVILGLANNTKLLTEAQEAAAKGANDNTQIYSDYLNQMNNLSAGMESVKAAWDRLAETTGNTGWMKDTIALLEQMIDGFGRAAKGMDAFLGNTPEGKTDYESMESLQKRNRALILEAKRIDEAFAKMGTQPISSFLDTFTPSHYKQGGPSYIGTLLTGAGRLKQIERERLEIEAQISRLLDQQAQEQATINEAPIPNTPSNLDAYERSFNRLVADRKKDEEEKLAKEKAKKEREAIRIEKAKTKIVDDFWGVVSDIGKNSRSKGGGSFSDLQSFWKQKVVAGQESENKKIINKFEESIKVAREHSDFLRNMTDALKKFVDEYRVVD